jgi:hypothetical protein
MADQPYRRTAPVGRGTNVPKLAGEWAPYVFEFPELPARGLSSVRIGFELSGEGEVWIDDVRLFDLQKFEDNQRNALSLTLQLTRIKLEQREYADLLRLLEGYWPRFLMANVTPAEGTLAQRPRATEKAPVAPEVPKASMLERLKRSVGDWWR